MKRLVLLLVALPAAASLLAWRPAAPPSLPEPLVERLARPEVRTRTWALLQHLTDRIGPRLSGSPAAEEAVRWASGVLTEAGLDVRRETIRVPVWVRGVETARLVAPVEREIVLTTLGGSVATPEGGIEAPVVEVASLEELDALDAARVRGRIVLFNRPVAPPTNTEEASETYRLRSPMRTRGPSAAAAKGAVASLVRSLGTADFRLPHTGALRYADDAPKIPAAAITSEDAGLIHRFLEAGDEVRVHLVLGPRTLPDVDSANVVADLRGREKPEEIVLIGGHLDSWDLGTGAIDNGAGVVTVMETLRILEELPVRPRRTVRGVLFMNEENGLRGGRGYEEAHRAEMARHVAAIETDSGGAEPIALAANVGPGGLERLRALLPLLAPTGLTAVTASDSGGADTSPLRVHAVPVIGLRREGTRYFDWHHTAADTLDKVDPDELAESVRAMAIVAWALADAEEPLPRPAPSPTASPVVEAPGGSKPGR